MIFATGYLPRFEFLGPEMLDVGRRRPAPACTCTRSRRRHPTLAVVGLLQPDSGLFPLAHWQSVAVARWLRLRESRPGAGGRVLASTTRAAGRGSPDARRQGRPPALVRGRPHRLPAGAARRPLASWRASRAHDRSGPGSLRFEDGRSPVAARSRREVLTRGRPTADEGRPPVLFVPGLGHGAWVFAEHWLEHTAARGFPAYAMSLRGHGDSGSAPRTLRAYAHDVVQVAARLPRQAVLVGHGAGALVVAHALAPLPGPGRGAGRAGARRLAGARRRAARQPVRHAARAVRRPLRLRRRQLFGPACRAAARGVPGRLRPDARGAVAAARRAAPSAGRRPAGAGRGQPGRPGGAAAALGRPAGTAAAPLLFPGMGHDLMLDAGWQEPIDAILDWLGKELAG